MCSGSVPVAGGSCAIGFSDKWLLLEPCVYKVPAIVFGGKVGLSATVTLSSTSKPASGDTIASRSLGVVHR